MRPSQRTLHLLAVLTLASPLAAQATLTTTFTSDNAGNVGGAVHFDLTVLHPNGVVVNRLDVNCSNPASTPAQLEVYTTDVGGTHAGNQVSPPPGTWFLRATSAITTAGQDAATVATLNKAVVLGPGTHGVTLVFRGCAARYTGTGTVPPTQTVFANADLRLDLGSAQNVPFTSGVFAPRVANVTVHYGILFNDVVDFTASVTSGASPLQVGFTDRSRTPSGPVSAWAWDFDDDGTIDSVAPNPTAVYASCGDRSVRLRVTTPSGTQDLLWQGLIAVDPLRAGFTATPEVGPPPLAVQFTDTSTLPPTGWAWDFDSNGVIDSTLQNPSHLFGPGCHDVTLTVTNGCRAGQVQKRITAAPDNLTTGFSANSFLNDNSVLFFDLDVTAAAALSVCGIDFTSLTPAGNPMTVDVWLTDGSAAGKEVAPDEWRRAASATGTTAGSNTPSRLSLDRPILLLPGHTYGVAVHHFGNASHYVNQSLPIGNADLTLTPLSAAYTPAGPFTVAPQYVPRQWVGTLHYLKETQWPQGAVTFFAPGCTGSLGVPGLEPVGAARPVVGTTLRLRGTKLPQNTGFMLFGFSNTQSMLGPLPLALAPFGMPGCTGRVSPDSTRFLIGAGNTAVFAFTIPASAIVAGFRFYNQLLVFDPGVNGFGGTMSDATAGLTGTF